MLRLCIQNPEQEIPYVNLEASWRIPTSSIIGATVRWWEPAIRIGREGELVVEVESTEQNCEITIPDKHALFSTLLLPEMQYWTTDDLRHGIPRKNAKQGSAFRQG